MKTQIKKVSADWRDVKNECRNTNNKDATNVPATKEFIKKILISEHSTIRLVRIKWRWEGIKSWIATHYSRHHIGFEKWISTQRPDRTGIDRDSARQDALVNMDAEANTQALINMGRYRLCGQASDETREHMEDLKVEIGNVGQEELSNVLVPNCIYRAGCSEFSVCQSKYNLPNFIKWANDNNKEINWLNIQARYDLYNEFFYAKRKEKGAQHDKL